MGEIDDERDIEVVQCHACGGTGERWNPLISLFDETCSWCHGDGYIERLQSKPVPEPSQHEEVRE